MYPLVLSKLCRICGERAKRGNEKSTPKWCTDYHSEIFKFLDTSDDNETIDSISITMMR